MVIFLPAFVLPVFILFGFQQVYFHCNPLASNAHHTIFGKHTHFDFLPLNDEGLLNCYSIISNSSQKSLSSSVETVGMKPDEKFLAKCSLIAKSFCSFILSHLIMMSASSFSIAV